MHPLEQYAARLSRAIDDHADDLVGVRRHIHRHPELSHEEFRTTAYLAERLSALGYEVHVRDAGTGGFADLTPPGFDPEAHPTVALRTDLDALPIAELNETPWRSQNDGVMHACGHDVHMSCAYGAALGLRRVADHLPGRVRLVLQHAEEIAPSGASDLIDFGALDGVDAILGLHCQPLLPVGVVGIRYGALTAAFDRFEFTIHGKAGHGARPHHTVDPIFAGVQLANALYHANSRVFDAREPSTLSIGEFHAGTVPNAIPGVATMSGTMRTLTEERRAEVEPLLNRLARGVATMTGTRIEIDLYRGSPAIINHDTIVDRFADAARAVLGDEGLRELDLPSMGSEDFSNFLAHVPGAMFRLGTALEGRQVHLLHTPRFDVDERAIGYGAQILSRAALGLLHDLTEDRQILMR
ncbi:MAG: amidohydrolase [Myxococcota bacterium]